ncbi:alpha/beta hydrolase [Photobacterium sanctipauli]|uniref:Alpha/beta hydrolase n=1 Tax=Photobacterium sanctipauli TaxID=1342794 RepID=A0A2T3NNI6_9GAMM|nr:alpha/beta hydrolase [Photobacterium sanctipauli]PSW17216.1 alpha/beta hydrolase [Photobacterium sanctipauli]
MLNKGLKKLLMLAVGVLPFAAQASGETANVANEEITVKHIELDTQVGQLAANIYLPEGVEKPPVVIVTGAWTTVKEQMPAVYARALADKGYAAVTFDFRGWGESDDTIKYLENPSRKTVDIRAVIDAVAKLEQIDSSRIAGLGICASAGYMLDAVAGNEQVKAAAAVAPWVHNKVMATEIYGGEESANGLLAAAEQAAKALEPVYIEAASSTNNRALMFQVPYYTETERGLIPEYDNQFNVASWDGWLNYDAQQSASKQDKPVLMVASESMALPAGAHQYLDNAGNNVSAVWLDDVSQFDFYDQPEAVSQAVEALVKHFDANL